MSLPSRERGLKFYLTTHCLSLLFVAPLAGAWIEITKMTVSQYCFSVAPLAGAWIEMVLVPLSALSKPVAPLAGAWIEILVREGQDRHM